jgi:hypothetical protein
MKTDHISGKKFDVGLFSLSYESRARAFVERSDVSFGRGCAIGYDFHHVFSYYKNKDFYEGLNFDVFEIPDEDLCGVMSDILSGFSDKEIDVFFDISSMSRHRISVILICLLENLKKGSTISVAYTPAKYSPPPERCPPVKYIGPICEELTGALGDLEKPAACIISLGYEENKALGAVNSIDPADCWLFVPVSREEPFKEKVLANNASLIGMCGGGRTLFCEIDDPSSMYRDMKSLLKGVLRDFRPIFLPLGPKIFTAVAVVLAHEFSPHVPVWRVSSGDKEEPVDREPDDYSIVFPLKK